MAPPGRIYPVHQDPLPNRVRVLILGGGIHGVGILHDLASRGWHDVHLIEKKSLGSGTSSRSTKLIHGGLRYLKHFLDYPLVAESLAERKILLRCAPDLVKPLELVMPYYRNAGMPPWMMRVGLTLYDLLARKAKIHSHRRLTAAEIQSKVPLLDQGRIAGAFSFWDAQTDDLALVRRVAASAQRLGAKITEDCVAERVTQTDEGWDVVVRKANGDTQQISALYVINALGPWANRFLEGSAIKPKFEAYNNAGIHLVIGDRGLKAGMLLQSPDDGRIFFVLPWLGKTLIGTTESIFKDDPDRLSVDSSEVQYLLERCNRFLSPGIRETDIEATFAGLRWLATDARSGISNTSRAVELGTHVSRRGFLLTIYGGKLTSYRSLSAEIGDKIMANFGEQRQSLTSDPLYWIPADNEFISPISRFQNGGVAYTLQKTS